MQSLLFWRKQQDYQLKNNEPTEKFAKKYLEEAQFFYKKVNEFRTKTVSNEN